MRTVVLLILLFLVPVAFTGGKCRKPTKALPTKPPTGSCGNKPCPTTRTRNVVTTTTPKRCCPAPTANVSPQTIPEAPTIIEPLWANDPCSDYYYMYCGWAESPLITDQTVLAIYANNYKFTVWSAEAQPAKRVFPMIMKMKAECDRNTLTWNVLSFKNITTFTCNTVTVTDLSGKPVPNPISDTFATSTYVNTSPTNLLTVVKTSFMCSVSLD